MSEAYKLNLAVPFFTQRDNTYIWQQIDADTNLRKGPKYPMAWRNCNITSLCMVLRYWGLTEETPDQMLEKVFAKKKENVLDDNGAFKTDKNGNPVTKWGWLHEATDEETNPRTGAARLENWEDLKKVAELYIEGPLWQQPGGEETDITNSFPIRSDNMWHNGIHLESAGGFYSIGAGRLVAARNAEVENHGSSSFALIKYQMPESHGQFFYALYMHLKKIDLKQELEDFFL